MSKSDFDAFVKRQQAEKRAEEAFDPHEQLREWTHYLSTLYQQIEFYLDKYTKNEGAYIEYNTITLNEDFIGDYQVPRLVLKIGRSTITFTPVGTMLIGSKGRVDVKGPRGSARLVLINKRANSARQLISVTITTPGDPPPPVSPSELVRQVEWVWKIATPPPRMEFIDLTDDAFFDMVLAVANA